MDSSSCKQLAPILKKLTASGASYDASRLNAAYEVAQSFYKDAVHWTGELMIDHTLSVLRELIVFEPDEDTVIACLLHHVLDLEVMTLVELEEQFGAKVRTMVSGIHLLSHVTLEGRRRSIEDLRVMLLSVSDDVRILLVILCGRVHCLKHVDQMDTVQARKFAQDTAKLFAPVAARLGIYSLKHRLEDSIFPLLYPHESQQITRQLHHIHKQYPKFLLQAKTMLASFLKEQDIVADIETREKQPFSIFQKMHKKSLTSLESIYDLFALRVIVDTEEDCYRVLGLLHQLGRPVPNRFKDYIAFPKPNGYQSLHTTLSSLTGLPDTFVEVQIRTATMNREANFGIAAHWSYKEHGATEAALQKVQLHALLASQESVDSEAGDGTILADHIFVLTPHAEIIELPEGATPLDFAFQVHTDLGLSFRSARVNGSIVPLDYHLKNGDVVEVIKHKHPKPSPQWMQMLKMASSRTKLRRYLQEQDRPHLVSVGKDLMNAELKKRGLPLLTTDLSILRVCDGKTMSLVQREDLLMKVGQGAERASSVLPRLQALEDQHVFLEKSKAKTSGRLRGKDVSVVVEGGLKMPLRFAKCCSPNTGKREEIAGNISRMGAIMIHKKRCRMFVNTNPERRVKVWWR